MLIMKKILSVVGIIGGTFFFWLQQSVWKNGSLIVICSKESDESEDW